MKVENRNIKYPRIELKTGELKFILPMDMDYHAMMEKHEVWIKGKENEIKEAKNNSRNLNLYFRNKEEVRENVKKIVDKYSKEYGLKVNRIIVKNLLYKWGSCSLQGNLTFNSVISYLPDYNFRYVVFHELMHLIERKHSSKYWLLVEEKFPDYKKIEKELLSYWFLINNKIGE
ncbi:MAG: M48 family metallopeptidase [Bacteroidetes bacterium]|nr:M48 family metallopeptidase [Bacteroidota bacterium]